MRLLTPVVTTSFTLELYSTWALCRIFCSQQIHRTEISPLGIKIFLTKMVDSAELLLSSQKYQEAKRQTSNHKSPSEPSPPVRTLSKLCHSWKKSGLKRRGRKLTLTEVLTATASFFPLRGRRDLEICALNSTFLERHLKEHLQCLNHKC